ncbi:MAG: DNA-directed RNA polymerase subunit B'' [Candidatus Altiarchaeota archaeon]|nr:DNA-directed RNA polymerase subunit B'' [Candidatus Altiarchaeota archaeon]
MKKAISQLSKAFFDEYGVARHHIDSFNIFLNEGMQRVIYEVEAMEPLIVPSGFDAYRLVFGKLRILHPVVKEADGSSSLLYPMEARIRNLTYSAPIQLEVIPERDGSKGEPVWADIGALPIMVKSDKCLLHGLSSEELVEVGEDPYDPGGYFIISGTERVLMSIEDLVPNVPLLEIPRSGTAEEIARLFSEVPGFRIPHLFERRSDGVIYVSWARVPKIPLAIVLKALGLETDKEIVEMISENPKFVEDIMVNIEMLEEIETQDDALDAIGKKLKIGQGTEYRVERSAYLMDNYLLPHIGKGKKLRPDKAMFVGSVAERLMNFHHGNLPADDKDHYGNKRLKLAGELMEQLFRAAFKTLANDMKYSFERIVKRGREPSPVTIIRSQLLTSRISSAMATGYWIGGRSGVAQHLQRLNFFDTMSHLRRVMSPLASGQPHFEARELHPTHWGKLCVAETPEGSNIGLRKNLALFAKLSYNTPSDSVGKHLKKVLEETTSGRRNA